MSAFAGPQAATPNQGSVVIPADGDYRITVFLFRNEARRGKKADFALDVVLK